MVFYEINAPIFILLKRNTIDTLWEMFQMYFACRFNYTICIPPQITSDNLSDEAKSEVIITKLKHVRGIDFVAISRKARSFNKSELAVELLEQDTRPAKQVPRGVLYDRRYFYFLFVQYHCHHYSMI